MGRCGSKEEAEKAMKCEAFIHYCICWINGTKWENKLEEPSVFKCLVWWNGSWLFCVKLYQHWKAGNSHNCSVFFTWLIVSAGISTTRHQKVSAWGRKGKAEWTKRERERERGMQEQQYIYLAVSQTQIEKQKIGSSINISAEDSFRLMAVLQDQDWISQVEPGDRCVTLALLNFTYQLGSSAALSLSACEAINPNREPLFFQTFIWIRSFLLSALAPSSRRSLRAYATHSRSSVL